jgi:hypothetical protein
MNTNYLNVMLIDNENDANNILKTIMSDSKAIVGMDIEAAVEMSRFGILCLLQVSTNILHRSPT